MPIRGGKNIKCSYYDYENKKIEFLEGKTDSK